MTTKIIECPGCPAHQQDQMYGNKIRVHNQGVAKGASLKAWICTVCKARREL